MQRALRHCALSRTVSIVLPSLLLLFCQLLLVAGSTNPTTSPFVASSSALAKSASRLQETKKRGRKRTRSFLERSRSHLSRFHFQNADDDCIWQEIRPQKTRYSSDKEWKRNKDALPSQRRLGPLLVDKKQPRPLIWFGPVNEQAMAQWKTSVAHSTIQSTTTSTPTEAMRPHPLRTNLFRIHVDWRTASLMSQSLGENESWGSELEIDFDEDTRLCLAKRVGVSKHRGKRSSDDLQAEEEHVVVGMGRWEIFPWGLWFQLMDASGNYEYTFCSQLHLNPFGSHAKLLQGSIVRYSRQEVDLNLFDADNPEDLFFIGPPRRKWFRPVVGTFAAKGIGIDTADLSYHDRRIGLSS